MKRINKDDDEEDEDGLDEDLEGFVEKGPIAGDAEEIAAGDAAARALFAAQQDEDEKQRTKETLQAVLFG